MLLFTQSEFCPSMVFFFLYKIRKYINEKIVFVAKHTQHVKTSLSLFTYKFHFLFLKTK